MAPEIEWMKRFEEPDRNEDEEIAGMDRIDYAALLAENEYR